MMDKKKQTPAVQMYCKYCGSVDVSRDATVRWDVLRQKWTLVSVQDVAYCDRCGEQSTLGEAELNGALDPCLACVPHVHDFDAYGKCVDCGQWGAKSC